MKKNIEIAGLLGAGKSTLVNKIIKKNPDIFYDRFDLAISPVKKFPNNRKVLNLASKLINLNTKNIWYNQDITVKQDQFSKNYPDFYDKAWDNLGIIIQSGFVPSSFWLRWYFNAWLLIALASERDSFSSQPNIFLHDEGISQRLLSVLAEKTCSIDFIVKYFDCVDLVIVYDQSIEKALQQAYIRDRKKRSKNETRIWIESHAVSIEKLKKYALTIEKIKIVKPEKITDILLGTQYAAKNS